MSYVIARVGTRRFLHVGVRGEGEGLRGEGREGRRDNEDRGEKRYQK